VDAPFYNLIANKEPAEFLRAVQVANALYPTLAEHAFPFFWARSYARTPLQDYKSSLFCNHKLQNHTTLQEWSFPNVVQATALHLNEAIFQNYKAIRPSLLEGCNVY
jgi:hypothetical protein